ncbi:hypothetical protein [Hymenobacter koreensis]|uniref:Uncharacterized protein n=1 Tax=Hymenobacter koreensis TaxID=1084523 RepID=A0ABP8JJQ1_9BACT
MNVPVTILPDDVFEHGRELAETISALMDWPVEKRGDMLRAMVKLRLDDVYKKTGVLLAAGDDLTFYRIPRLRYKKEHDIIYYRVTAREMILTEDGLIIRYYGKLIMDLEMGE